MAEHVKRDLKVAWITARIEYTANTSDLERFFFMASDGKEYYINLNKNNVSSELTAISLIRDAFINDKPLNVWWEGRSGKRWLKAVNLHR